MKGEPVQLELEAGSVRPPLPRSFPPERRRPPTRTSRPAPERRRRGDFWSRLVPKVAACAWALLAIAAGFFASAQPPTQLGFFARLSTRVVRSYWDRGDLGVALACCGGAWALSLFAMIVHSRRVGRSDDRVHVPTLLAGVVASRGIVAVVAILV
ncbi:MAG: hypothetical protein RLO52_11460 [Sandaracinaceae bacterium]